MVRFVGHNLTMDNREELLDALNEFSRKQPKEIPLLLEQFLKRVAKTGETLFPWTLLKSLFVAKLEEVMTEFGKDFIAEQIPPCPNVENARYDVYRTRIMEAVNRFHGAPFTIQRLCELLTDPRRHYKRCDKFLRGLEKNILVVSTVDPFGRKVVSESKNIVNGMDSGADDNSNNSAASSGTPPLPVPTWHNCSTTTVWPHSADIITPSTAPLLEVCDLPDPSQASAAVSAVSAADQPPAINGIDVTSTTVSVEIPTDTTISASDSTTAPVEAETAAVSSSSTETAAAPSGVTTVTPEPVGEAVDSSEQHVAAEEMVGVEESAVSAEAVCEPATVKGGDVLVETATGKGGDFLVEMATVKGGDFLVETANVKGGDVLVETEAVTDEVLKESAEVVETSGEATPADSGDWLLKKGSDNESEAAPVGNNPPEPASDSVVPASDSVVPASDSTNLAPDTPMDLDCTSDPQKQSDIAPVVTAESEADIPSQSTEVGQSAGVSEACQQSNSEAVESEPECSMVTEESDGLSRQRELTEGETSSSSSSLPSPQTSAAAAEAPEEDCATMRAAEASWDQPECCAAQGLAENSLCDETDASQPSSSDIPSIVSVLTREPPQEDAAPGIDSVQPPVVAAEATAEAKDTNTTPMDTSSQAVPGTVAVRVEEASSSEVDVDSVHQQQRSDVADSTQEQPVAMEQD